MIRANRATLSIRSDSLTHDQITTKLQIESDSLRGSSRAPQAWTKTWEDDGLSDDQTGFASLRALVDRLLPVQITLDELKNSSEMSLWWSGDSDSWQGGFVIPNELLRDLGELGIDLYGTAFMSDESTEDPTPTMI
jgi:hypothetical protein